jgi:hypothetical protein
MTSPSKSDPNASINFVDAMFNERRNNVKIKRREGKAAKSKGSDKNIATKSTMTAIAMFVTISKSNKKVGMGMIIRPIIKIVTTANTKSLGENI